MVNSQNEGFVDEDKMNQYDKNEVLLHINLTMLTSQLKLQQNELVIKILKKTIECIENHLLNINKDVIYTKIPDNISSLNRYCLKTSHSILKTIPIPICTNYGHIVNALAKEPMRYALMIGSLIAILCPEYIEEDIKKIVNNTIGYS